VVLTEAEVIRQFLDLQYGDDTGTAWISVGAGRETEKTFSDNKFDWPAQKDEIVNFVVARNEAGYNVWFAAHLSHSKKSKAEEGMGRAKGMSVKRRRLHVDIDRVLTDEDAAKIRDLDAWVVYSGSPGHVHAYIELESSVDVGTYHRLEDLLVTHFDSDVAVCRDNGLLRIPGTINQMSAKKSHPTAMVTWDGRITQTRWTPEQIERVIGVETVEKVAAKTALHPEVDHGTDPIIPAPCTIPKPVLDVIASQNFDRSAKATSIINACKANYLTLEETYFCLLADPEQKQRLADKGPRYMFGDTRKMYGTADQYNAAEIADRQINADLLSRPTPPAPLQYQEPPRQMSEQEQDDADTAILMGMAHAQQQFEAQPQIQSAEEQLEAFKQRKSWAPVNLESILDGSFVPLMPTMFTRKDGISLLYPGLTHSFFGESESGKSLILQLECINLLRQGFDVLYLDFEDQPQGVVGRFIEFGCDKELIRRHLVYVRPDEKFNEESAEWQGILSRRYALAVIDGVTEAMGLTGHELIDNSDVAEFSRLLPNALASKTGAAVVMIDHVSKSSESRGRGAIGGQHKLAAITGAAYLVEPETPLGRGKHGVVVLRLAKDRPGWLRDRCGQYRKGDRTQEACRVNVDSTMCDGLIEGQAPTWSFEPYTPELTDTQKQSSLHRMIFDIVAHAPGSNKTVIIEALKQSGVRTRRQEVLDAIDLLVHLKHLTLNVGARNAHNYSTGNAIPEGGIEI
jgi:hypothetical protein